MPGKAAMACCILMLVFSNSMVAQPIEKITVKSGEDLSEVLSAYGMYRFPAFKDGTVIFRNGSNAGGKMNYNIFLQLIQFIDPKGDTLVISNPETIDSVYIDSSLFYYNKGYFQVVADYGNCKLALKQKIEFRPVKIGAMGLPSNGTSGLSYESISTYHVINSRLTLNEDIIVLKQNIYYLFYKKYRDEKANRQGFLLAFAGHKDEVDAFIRANRINFDSLPDLKKLTEFCLGLK